MIFLRFDHSRMYNAGKEAMRVAASPV